MTLTKPSTARGEAAAIVLLATLVGVIEVVLLLSYLRGTQANSEFGGTSNFLTTLANVQRETIRLQVEVNRTLVNPPAGLAEIDQQRAILESQVRTLAAATDDFPEADDAFAEVVAPLPEIDRLVDEMRPGEPSQVAAVGPRLEAALAAAELQVKRVYDRQERIYFERTAETLEAHATSQLLLVVVAFIVGMLGLLLGVTLRRRVRREFAHAYFRLETEMTERVKIQEVLRHQAYHDSLTGLANRRQFLERLETALSESTGELAVLFVDLDDFKAINDARGHAIGDQTLAAVGGRILRCVREGDLAARLGGDEFAVLLVEAEPDTPADRVAERILAALSEPMSIGTATVHVRATIGVAVARQGETRPVSADELLRNADIAMYVAKTQGKSRVEIFAPELHQEAIRRLGFKGELARAIEENELVVHYQPIVELASGRLTAVEALVRWRHPERGLLSPAEFIPSAEENGMIGAIDRWVLHEACGQAVRWAEQPGREPIGMSVNLSTRHLDDDRRLVDDVVAALRESGLAPAALTLEFTESAMVRDLSVVVEMLGRLKALGVRIAIDDFGIGYSSLGHLARLPVDILKIDRSFVQALYGGEEQAALSRAIVGIGPALHLETIAEGIEQPEQLASMVEAGCQFGQGFYLARPMEASAIDALLQASGPIGALPSAPAGAKPNPTGAVGGSAQPGQHSRPATAPHAGPGSARIARSPSSDAQPGLGRAGARKRLAHQRLRLLDEPLEVFVAEEALGVDLVDVLRAGRTGGEPAMLGGDLETADRGTVARSRGQDPGERLAGEL